MVARDENGAAQGEVVITDASYQMLVPVTRTTEEGVFDGKVLTLRVDAQGYPGSFVHEQTGSRAARNRGRHANL